MPHKGKDVRLSDRERVEHMLLAATDALAFIEGRSRADLDTDAMLRRAVVNCVQEIGEAAAKVSDEGRARIPDVPWPKIVGMRHILVHVYHDLDLNAVWNVVTRNLASLVDSLEEALQQWSA